MPRNCRPLPPDCISQHSFHFRRMCFQAFGVASPEQHEVPKHFRPHGCSVVNQLPSHFDIGPLHRDLERRFTQPIRLIEIEAEIDQEHSRRSLLTGLRRALRQRVR
jgi:hypothetical protein